MVCSCDVVLHVCLQLAGVGPGVPDGDPPHLQPALHPADTSVLPDLEQQTCRLGVTIYGDGQYKTPSITPSVFIMDLLALQS